jgi:hypothetical protein
VVKVAVRDGRYVPDDGGSFNDAERGVTPRYTNGGEYGEVKAEEGRDGLLPCPRD